MSSPRISLVASPNRAMAPVDLAWLRMDHPTNLMMVTALLSFDQPPSAERLRSTVSERLLRFRRFRERVIECGRGRSRRCWQLDPHFDLGHHVRSLTLPAPGDESCLRELVGRLIGSPLDADKPLWQIHRIDNFGGGALLVRIHHCIADGAALMQVLLGLTDETFGKRPSAPARRGLLQATAAELRRDLELLAHPARLGGLARGGARGAAAVARLLLRPRDPRTVLKGSLGVAKRAAWSEALDLADFKAIGRMTGSTVNDVLLAAVTGALRAYLEIRGDRVDGLELRAAVPVDLRRPDERSRLGNRFGLVFVALPVGIADPLERLFTVRHRMRELKESSEAAAALRILSTLGRTGAESQRRLVELVGGKASVVVTNVPGPRDPLSLGGAAIRSMMFWVPMSGRVALGISILSYAGRVRLGVASDAGLIPDPGVIASAFQRELDHLLALSRPPAGSERPLSVGAA